MIEKEREKRSFLNSKPHVSDCSGPRCFREIPNLHGKKTGENIFENPPKKEPSLFFLPLMSDDDVQIHLAPTRVAAPQARNFVDKKRNNSNKSNSFRKHAERSEVAATAMGGGSSGMGAGFDDVLPEVHHTTAYRRKVGRVEAVEPSEFFFFFPNEAVWLLRMH